MSDFECLRCAECCKWPGYVYLAQEDVKRISEFLSISEFEFVNRYAEMTHKPRLNLKTGKGGACVFLEGNECAVQPVKPLQCAGFPIAWKIEGLESFCSGKRKDSEKP